MRAAREHPEALPPRVACNEPLVVRVQREDDEAEVHKAQQREPPARARAAVSAPGSGGRGGEGVPDGVVELGYGTRLGAGLDLLGCQGFYVVFVEGVNGAALVVSCDGVESCRRGSVR